MFDMGFTELVLIGIVALIVIGPERLPGVARTAGKYFGKLRRFMTNVRADVESELRADELREMLGKQQEELQSLKKVVDEVGKDIGSEVGAMEAEIDREAAEYQKKAAEEGTSWTDNIGMPESNDEKPESKKTTRAKSEKKAVTKARKKTVKKSVKKSVKSTAKPKSRAKSATKSTVKTTESKEE